ncbi:MAG: hypothetical protein AAB947_00105 [Patescibacteria group bacterium]
MLIIRTDDFERALAKLPAQIREQCEAQVVILKNDWRDTRLHIKKLREPYKGIYSFRIMRGYRALFYFDTASNIIIFDADHRKDIYR